MSILRKTALSILCIVTLASIARGQLLEKWDTGSTKSIESSHGKAYIFNGTNFISTKNVTPAGSKSIEVWFRPHLNIRGGRQTIIGTYHYAAPDQQKGFTISWGWGRVWGLLAGGDKKRVSLRSPGMKINGKWTHVVLTHDSEKGIARLFVNGIQVDIQQIKGYTRSIFDLIMGKSRHARKTFFVGDAGPVFIYDRVLPPDEVKKRATGKALPVPAKTEKSSKISAAQWFKENKVRAALFNRLQPFEAAKILKNADFNMALITNLAANSSELELDNLALWAKKINAAGIKFVPYVWYTPDFYRNNKPTARRFVNRGGLTCNAPCPLDKKYWQQVIDSNLVTIAKESRKIPIFSLAVDFEMYGTDQGHFDDYCYCDNCFGTFLNKPAKSLPPPTERFAYLLENGKLEEFKKFQYNTLLKMATATRKKVHAINPELPLVIILYMDTWFIHAIRDGFLQDNGIVLGCMEQISYRPGYTAAIERQNKLMHQKPGLLFIPGLWHSFWNPKKDLNKHAWLLGSRADGYFFGSGSRFWNKDVSPEMKKYYINSLSEANKNIKAKKTPSQAMLSSVKKK